MEKETTQVSGKKGQRNGNSFLLGSNAAQKGLSMARGGPFLPYQPLARPSVDYDVVNLWKTP